MLIDGDSGTLSIDTINEITNASGVTIEQVLLKDQNVTAHTISAQNYSVGGTNFVSASRQGNFRDLEVKSGSNNTTMLIDGDTGDMTLSGDISANNIKGTTLIVDTLDVSGNATFDDRVIINGELIFNSTATKITSTNTDVSDNLIVLNSGYSGNNINDSGIIVDRGDLDNAFIGWDESEDKFVLGTTTADGSQTGNLTFNSADLSANDASFNSVDVKSIKVNGANVSGDLDGISEGTFSRYTPQVDGNGDLIEPTQWSSASTENGMIFSKHIVPSQNDTYDIGATGGARWNALYVKEIFVSGDSLVAGPVKAISVVRWKYGNAVRS